jgi:hypothetical protein
MTRHSKYIKFKIWQKKYLSNGKDMLVVTKQFRCKADFHSLSHSLSLSLSLFVRLCSQLIPLFVFQWIFSTFRCCSPLFLLLLPASVRFPSRTPCSRRRRRRLALLCCARRLYRFLRSSLLPPHSSCWNVWQEKCGFGRQRQHMWIMT